MPCEVSISNECRQFRLLDIDQDCALEHHRRTKQGARGIPDSMPCDFDVAGRPISSRQSKSCEPGSDSRANPLRHLVKAVSEIGSIGDEFPTEHLRIHIDGFAIRDTACDLDIPDATCLEANRIRDTLIASHQDGWT